MTFRDDCSYTPRLLACTAMLWAWSDEPTLLDRFQTVRRVIHFVFSLQAKLAGSCQAFFKLLLRRTATLVAVVQPGLRERVRQKLPACWQLHGYAMFGVDGSRLELPRTRSHEAAYSAARRSKKKRRAKKTKAGSSRHAFHNVCFLSRFPPVP